MTGSRRASDGSLAATIRRIPPGPASSDRHGLQQQTLTGPGVAYPSGSHTSEDAALLKAHAAEADIYGLFTLAETGWVKRAPGVSARTDTPVPFVNGIGVVGGLPLRGCPGGGFQTVPSARATQNGSLIVIGAGQEGIAVARYYFDIHDGAQSARDEEGTELDPEAAVQAAARLAAEVGKGRLLRGDTSDVVIEVRDERGQRVCTVRASMTIERHLPSPHNPHPWSA